MPRSHSSLAQAGARQKWREAFDFFWMRVKGVKGAAAFEPMLRQLDGYREAYERVTGKPFAKAKILEIGYGARPVKLIALMSMGADVRGIDLDMPILKFSLKRLAGIMKQNGAERALKSFVRSVLFDRSDRNGLAAALKMRGYSLRIDPSRFLVGDAAEYDFAEQPDLVYSEDVFEHIPPEALEKLVASLARKIAPDGLALIRPNIYPGIMGNHLTEWYLDLVDQKIPRETEPWEHLRKKRFTANTYLNCLPRSAYRAMFGKWFEILEENVTVPDLGRQWLTDDVKAELAEWSDDELFSNQVQFVLRPKRLV